ncbi:unnamed protein product [Angiostrongylus costaricensis]|uniref:ZM domain-containing protein n=1 Tax=Angiostrongylus costaricensis TaxID=334426 RepID=A0A0R3PCD1_ANGCS|nr:unnamed protein product [Angiostrongylus costaricensis]
MDGRQYLKSYYYPARSKTKKDCQTDSETSEYSLSTTHKHVEQETHHSQVQALQTNRIASYPFMEHQLAPKPAVEKPFIESSYCQTLNSYSIDYFMEGRPKTSRVESDVNIHTIAPHHRYQTVQEALEHPTADKPNGACVQALTTLCDTNLDEKNNAKTYEMSEYAWQRHDEEAAAQYALPYQRHSATGKNNEVGMDQAQPQHNELLPTNPAEEFSVPCSKTCREEESVYSKYIGIPNDLFLAYRSKPFITTSPYKPTPRLTAQPPSKYAICNVDSSVSGLTQHLSSNAVENDEMRFNEKADEIRSHLPDFSTEIELELTDKTAATHYRVAEHCAPQHSAVGKALTHVKPAAVLSEYQVEDLNDLTSCVDAL